MVILSDDVAWAQEVTRLRREGMSAAFLLASGPDALVAAEEMAAELGRGDPWVVLDRRGETFPAPGMGEGI